MSARHAMRYLSALVVAGLLGLKAPPAYAEYHPCAHVHEEPVPYALPFYGFPDGCGHWGSIGFYPYQGFAAYNVALPLWYYPAPWEHTDYYLTERNSPFGVVGPTNELEFYYSD